MLKYTLPLAVVFFLMVIVLVCRDLKHKHQWHQHLDAVHLSFELPRHIRESQAFDKTPSNSCNTIFVGDSFTAYASWHTRFPSKNLLERGIAGDMTQGISERLPEICRHHPSVVILECGINDLNRGDTVQTVILSIKNLIFNLHKMMPETKIILESIYPLNPAFALALGKPLPRTDVNSMVNEVNIALKNLPYICYVDVNSHLADSSQALDKRFTTDGMHLSDDGYKVVTSLLSPYVN